MKKKLLSVLTILILAIGVSACAEDVTDIDGIEINIGSSADFSNREIMDAVHLVIKEFDFAGCTLTHLWYDEEESATMVGQYMRGGRGSSNGVLRENVIVLLSNFDVDSSVVNSPLNPDSTYTNWNWILIRDSKNAPWRVDDWGY